MPSDIMLYHEITDCLTHEVSTFRVYVHDEVILFFCSGAEV